jgi:N-acyl-D-aspartate/D-glutamate deacylase
MYDAMLERDGRAKFFIASSNYSEGNLNPTLELMRHKDAVVALGDGGAHYGVVCDASYATFMLTHWVRDRKRGERLSLAEAVHMMTEAPARLHRFKDRGRIAPGLKADINVIDMDRLKLFSPSIVFDLPAGGKRLTQEAEGYVTTLVSGIPIRREGKDTGARPGHLVRNAGI